MQKAYFPMKYYNLSQGYIDSSTHKGTYALDNSGEDRGKDPIYAPFDCTVTKLYVKKGHAYTVWVTSDKKVLCANKKEEYLTLMIVHPEDIDKLRLGQKFRQGQIICHEGQTGNASGNHAHLELGIGKCGWHKNSYGIYMIDNPVKIEDYLMLRNDAIIKNDNYKGNKYIIKRENEINFDDKKEVKFLTTDLNERIGAGTNYEIVNVLYKNTAVTVYEIKDNWARIEKNMWVSNNFLTFTKPNNHIKSMEVTNCIRLNVRSNPNGKILTSIPVNTVVSVLEVRSDWTKIGPNKWVYNKYLK